jgi:hypothetical protein
MQYRIALWLFEYTVGKWEPPALPRAGMSGAYPFRIQTLGS